MMMILIACTTIFGFGCLRGVKPAEQTKLAIDRNAILIDARKQGLIMDTGESEHMKDQSLLVDDQMKKDAPDSSLVKELDFRLWSAAALADVTGGSSYGIAHIKVENGMSRLFATFGGLPEPTDGSFYEGWLVKRGDGMRIIDLGKITLINPDANLTYATKTNLSEYDFFVVTLQSPNQRVPGEHILEGMFR